MDAQWYVVGFNHRNNRVYYEWTHTMTDVTSVLTPPELASLLAWSGDNDIWFHSGHQKFLSRNAGEQSAIETKLTAEAFSYDTEASDLAALGKMSIEQAGITRRDEIADAMAHVYSTHHATVTAVDTSKPRGITVQRGGVVLDCYGTMIPAVGDTVVVIFGDDDPGKPCVIGKVLGL